MPQKPSDGGAWTLQRNRERILEVAKEAFTRSGADASLDEIARQAGVGVGSLYRHFRARDALIEAVYHTEVSKLAAAAREVAEKLSPVEALRAWMLLFVDYIATKQIFAPALNSVVGDSPRRRVSWALMRPPHQQHLHDPSIFSAPLSAPMPPRRSGRVGNRPESFRSALFSLVWPPLSTCCLETRTRALRPALPTATPSRISSGSLLCCELIPVEERSCSTSILVRQV